MEDVEQLATKSEVIPAPHAVVVHEPHIHEHEHGNECGDKEEGKELQLTDCVEFGPGLEDLYHVGTAGLKARVLNGLDDMVELKELRVRSNLLYKMTGIENLVNLQHLELYDNQILLDLSFNEIRVIPDLSHLVHLEELYVANNKLTHITGISSLTTLKKLDLGANRIRVIEGLDNLTSLEQLWLGKNKIEKIQGLTALAKLKIISVQSNRLLSIENFDSNTELGELYLSHNGIEAIDNIGHLSKLTILDLGVNRIQHIPNIMETLSSLEDFWINDNQIASFDELEHLIPLTKLETIYLERNPLASDFEYRKRIHATLPSVKQIDATPI